ncbi:uncharacterized protein LOC144302548 isoform X2 [Canis aureus]
MSKKPMELKLSVRENEIDDKIRLGTRSPQIMSGSKIRQQIKGNFENQMEAFSGLDGTHTGEEILLNSLIQVLMLQPHPEMMFNQDTPWPSSCYGTSNLVNGLQESSLVKSEEWHAQYYGRLFTDYLLNPESVFELALKMYCTEKVFPVHKKL